MIFFGNKWIIIKKIIKTFSEKLNDLNLKITTKEWEGKFPAHSA